MSDKILLVKQPAGLGDILYCLKIAKVIQSQTEFKKVIWPVVKEYCYLGEYIDDDSISFPVETDIFLHKDIYLSNSLDITQNENVLFIPLQSSNTRIPKCTCHNSNLAHGHIKYNFCNIDYLDWKNFFSLNRNYQRENSLFKRLNLDKNEKFNLINENYGTYPNYVKANLQKPKNEYRNIYVDFYENSRIFDWMGVMEIASEIHTIETSLCYLIEKMNIEENVYIYSKYKSINANHQDDYSYMKSHCSPKWNFV